METSRGDYFSPGHTSKYLANAYYVGKIGALKIDFNTDYYWYGDKNRMNIKESVTGEDNQIKNSQADSYRNNRNSLVASKLVLGFPLFKGELSVGGEYSSLNR